MSYGLREGDPLSAKVEVEAESVLLRGAQGRFHIVTHGEMTCDADTFYVADEVTRLRGRRGRRTRGLHEVVVAPGAARPRLRRRVTGCTSART